MNAVLRWLWGFARGPWSRIFIGTLIGALLWGFAWLTDKEERPHTISFWEGTAYGALGGAVAALLLSTRALNRYFEAKRLLARGEADSLGGAIEIVARRPWDGLDIVLFILGLLGFIGLAILVLVLYVEYWL